MNTIQFSCRDCGHDCSFEATGINERHVKQQIIEHMHTAHTMEALPADTLLKIFTSIRIFAPDQVMSEDAMADTMSV